MFAYVARQAITDRNKNIYAYELLFRDGKSNCFPDIAPDEATSKILTSSHLTLGVEEITDGKLAFINFHEDSLLYRFPTSLDPQNVVIEIVETVPISEKLVKACKHIRDLGYQIALDDHDFDPKWDIFLPYIHIVKVDIADCDYDVVAANIGKFKAAGVKLVAERIETVEQFERYKKLGFDYFQGYYFAVPEVTKQKNIPSSKLTLLDLMNASSVVNFDFERISKIIAGDVGLYYMLLRFINNPVINKSNKITSLRHALNYMGEVEVKKFIALLALANLADGKPPELVQMSLVRAKFCELVAHARKDTDNPPTGFLVGLFSLLDALLDQDMENLVAKLPLSDDLKFALCGKESFLKQYLALAIALERANWAKVKRLAAQLKLDQRMLHSFYNESLKWGLAMAQSNIRE